MNKFTKRVSEDEQIVPIVEPELELVMVAVQMLARDLVETADHAALEQRPATFDGVGVDIARTNSSCEWLTVSCRVSASATPS